MDGRRIVQQGLDAQRVRDSHSMGPGLSVAQAIAACNAVSSEGRSPGSAEGREIVRMALRAGVYTAGRIEQSNDSQLRSSPMPRSPGTPGHELPGPGNCACRGKAYFSSSCECGVESVACEYNPTGDTCNCIVTCKTGTTGTDENGEPMACYAPVLSETADACNPIGREPDVHAHRGGGAPGLGVDPNCNGPVSYWSAARTTPVSWHGRKGCVVNYSAGPVYVWWSGEPGPVVLPKGANTCSDAPHQDIDHVRSASGTWWKVGVGEAIVDTEGHVIGAERQVSGCGAER